jgi:hypothetical protein
MLTLSRATQSWARSHSVVSLRWPWTFSSRAPNRSSFNLPMAPLLYRLSQLQTLLRLRCLPHQPF